MEPLLDKGSAGRSRDEEDGKGSDTGTTGTAVRVQDPIVEKGDTENSHTDVTNSGSSDDKDAEAGSAAASEPTAVPYIHYVGSPHYPAPEPNNDGNGQPLDGPNPWMDILSDAFTKFRLSIPKKLLLGVDLPSYLENEENEDVMEMKQVLIDFGHQAEGLLKDRAKLLESGLTVREIVVALRSCRETMGSFSTLLKRTFLDNFTVEHPLGATGPSVVNITMKGEDVQKALNSDLGIFDPDPEGRTSRVTREYFAEIDKIKEEGGDAVAFVRKKSKEDFACVKEMVDGQVATLEEALKDPAKLAATGMTKRAIKESLNRLELLITLVKSNAENSVFAKRARGEE